MTDADGTIESIKRLPPFPDVSTKALKILEDPDASVDQVISPLSSMIRQSRQMC